MSLHKLMENLLMSKFGQLLCPDDTVWGTVEPTLERGVALWRLMFTVSRT